MTSPPGTYRPPGSKTILTDPGGYYSPANATAPTLDPAGTYSSPYALNRTFVDWQNNSPDTISVGYTSQTAVENFYGVTSQEAAWSRAFFRGYANVPGITAYFTRENFGQRPHLIGGNINAIVTSNNWAAVNGPISITFNSWVYNGNVNLAGAVSSADAAVKLYTALNKNRQVLAQSKNDTIAAQSVSFTGHFDHGAQLVVNSGSGVVIGGIITGNGVIQDTPSANTVIFQHDGTPGGAGDYSVFGQNWVPPAGRLTGEPMTETYGILTVGSVQSGHVVVGSEVSGPGVPLFTYVEQDLGPAPGGGENWLVNNNIPASGNFVFLAPELTVQDNEVTGRTQNNSYFMLQPQGASGFNQNPSTLSYASGTAADELGLSQAFGAIDSNLGGEHQSIANSINGMITNVDQFGNPIHFGSFASLDPRLNNDIAAWIDSAAGMAYQLFTVQAPAGQSTAVTDPIGSWSDAGASSPIWGTPPPMAPQPPPVTSVQGGWDHSQGHGHGWGHDGWDGATGHGPGGHD
jgi:hypothetical protein